MAVARDIEGKKNRIVSIISNWTTVAGQGYEAMSNAGYLDCNMLVILNDSRHSLHPKLSEGPKMTISPLSSTLSKLQSSRSFRRFREAAKVGTCFLNHSDIVLHGFACAVWYVTIHASSDKDTS